MADPSSAHPASTGSALDARAFAQDQLSRLPVDLGSLPKEVHQKLEERARSPDRRLMVGRYVVVGELGRGGMGVVYDAWDPQIERRVAIKTVEPELVPEEDRDEVIERFRRETKIVGRLHHPGIVTIYDYGEEREVPGAGASGSRLFYYVMEYLEGMSLARAMRERRAFPDVEAVTIVAHILEALHVSHCAGVIHRDIKPSNIFLRNGTQAVLLDFGIAKTSSVALTRQGQILGTPSYLAPERLREKESPVDGRADIFSLGVLLFTMLTGEAPFVGDDVYDVIDKIAKTAHPKLGRNTPSGQALTRVLDRMLAKRPDDRYANSAEAAAALRGVLVLLKTNAEVDELLVQGVRVRENMHENQATEVATPSSALDAVNDAGDEADTGRHAVAPRVLSSTDVNEATPANASPPEDMIGGPSSETPVRMSQLLQTLPELSLQRDTRELERGNKTPAPPRTLVKTPPPAVSISESGSHVSYDGHSPSNDETTDDQTIADPDAGKRDLGGFQLLPPKQQAPQPPPLPTAAAPSPPSPPLATVKAAKANSGPVVSVSKSPSAGTPAPMSAKSPFAGTPLPPPKTPSGGVPVSRAPSQKPQSGNVQPLKAPPRPKRSRIEASLVDEDEVVVKPAPLDALKPDELPTQTGFRVPSSNGGGTAKSLVPPPLPGLQTVAEEVVKARGDSRVVDPADQPARDETVSGLIVAEERLDSDSAEHEAPRSAAVARKTFGARGAGKTQAHKGGVHVRVIGNVSLGSDRMRIVRRRLFMLLAAMLAAIAVGLLLGRFKQRASLTDPPAKDAQLPSVEPRAAKALLEKSTEGEPAIVSPPPASEILQEASAAYAEEKFDKAERLFDSAVRASAEKSEIRARAMLGHGDALRQLDKRDRAIEVYRTLLNEYPRGPESENARVALQELGVEIIPVRRATPPKVRTDNSKAEAGGGASESSESESGSGSESPREPPIKPVKQPEITANMSPEEKCLAVAGRYLNDPTGGIEALKELIRTDSRAGCAYWHMGVAYARAKDDRGALNAYRRFLEVDPNTLRRGAVEQRIKDLERKLEDR